MAERISFHKHELKVRLPKATITREWIQVVAAAHQRKIEHLDFIFCSDDYLLEINRQFLGHDYLTDIITFDLGLRQAPLRQAQRSPHLRQAPLRQAQGAEEDLQINGEIYISVDRVRENAEEYHVTFEKELRRVIIHGVLHLVGYKDKTKAQKAAMRQKEEACLSLLHVPRGTWGRRAEKLFHVEH